MCHSSATNVCRTSNICDICGDIPCLCVICGFNIKYITCCGLEWPPKPFVSSPVGVDSNAVHVSKYLPGIIFHCRIWLYYTTTSTQRQWLWGKEFYFYLFGILGNHFHNQQNVQWIPKEIIWKQILWNPMALRLIYRQIALLHRDVWVCIRRTRPWLIGDTQAMKLSSLVRWDNKSLTNWLLVNIPWIGHHCKWQCNLPAKVIHTGQDVMCCFCQNVLYQIITWLCRFWRDQWPLCID